MDYAEPPPFTVEAQGHRLTFHAAGADRLAALLALIEGARESLRMAFYIFAEDASGVRVRDALTAAAARGVAVSLIVDGFGADARRAFFAEMVAAGGTFCCFSPRWNLRYLIRNHQKIVVADDARAMIGGFNVADDYFAPPAAAGWCDLAIEVEGRAVADLAQWFDALHAWAGNPRANWRAIRRMVRQWQPGDGPVRVLIGGPTRGLSSWVRNVRSDLLGGARLDMVMAYFSPSKRAMRAIGKLSRRGRARLVLAAKSDNGATIGATRSLYGYLLRKGAEVWEFEATKLHTKLIVIDDKSYFGSANFDMRSLYLNLEVMLRVEDRALADRLRAYVASYLPASTAITPALHRSRAGLFNRARWRLSWFLVAVVDYTVTRRLNLGL
ncbi:MAG: phosphatidylserine/phosphatidylglycerophosphate/cardiolipin synthase family protein [Cypionkella sp.]